MSGLESVNPDTVIAIENGAAPLHPVIGMVAVKTLSSLFRCVSTFEPSSSKTRSADVS
jgi:hypothetical protein